MANIYDFNITQGGSYSVFLTAQNSDGSFINLSGYTGVGYVKNFFGDDTPLLNLKPTSIEPFISGKIALSGQPSDTENLPVGSFEYSVKITNGVSSIQVLCGDFNISPSTCGYEPTGGFISV